jgi:hypothetical protein
MGAIMTGPSDTVVSDPVENLIHNFADTWRNFIVEDAEADPMRKIFWTGFLIGMLHQVAPEAAKAAHLAYKTGQNTPNPGTPCSTL